MSKRTCWKLLAVVAMVPIGVSLPSSPVVGATFTVTTTADVVNGGDGVTSLREAVNEAASLAGADIIDIPAGVYELACPLGEEDNNVSGDLDIVEHDVTLRGPQTGTATIRPAAGCQERVIEIRDFGAPANVVTIERLTITGGRPSGPGGGIHSGFTQTTVVTIRDTVITDNRAGDDPGAGPGRSGGGVFLNGRNTVTIEGSTITDNSVGAGGNTGSGATLGYLAAGGGVAHRTVTSTDLPGPVTITDSTISNNTGGIGGRGGGGGLWLDALEVVLTDVTISMNTLPSDPTGRAGGNGAGASIEPWRPGHVVDVTVVGGSIDGNTIGSPADGVGFASVFGGAGGGLHVRADGGTVSIDGTTFDANAAGRGKGNAPAGGGGNLAVRENGVSAPYLDISLVDVTVDGGVAGTGSASSRGGGGGGAELLSAGGDISVVDSSFGGNTAGDGENGGPGGGLSAETFAVDGGTITISGSSFSANVAGASEPDGSGGSGGGANLRVGITGSGASTVSVTDSSFVGNVAGDGAAGNPIAGFGGRGGGLSVSADGAVIDGVTATSNRSGDGGDGIAPRSGGDGGGLYFSGGVLALSGSSFSANESGRGGSSAAASGQPGGDGGGAFVDAGQSVLVETTTFAANTTGEGGDGGTGANGGHGGGLRIFANGAATGITVRDTELTGNVTGDGGAGAQLSGGGGGFGGGLRIDGDESATTLERVVIDGNSTGDGGDSPLLASPGSNAARGGNGGGVFIDDSGSASLTVLDSSIADNSSGRGGSTTGPDQPGALGGFGGGLYAAIGTAADGAVVVERTSITGNASGDSGAGGADGPDIGSEPGTSPPGGFGGGVWAWVGPDVGAEVVVRNSTIAGNITGLRAGSSSGGQGDGGGIFVATGSRTATLEHATVTGNEASNGDNVMAVGDEIRIGRSVVGEAGTAVSTTRENCGFGGATNVVSEGYNVETDGDTCRLNRVDDITDIAGPVLGPLQDNGGPGLSRLPLIIGESPLPVLDRIPLSECPLAVDQLGTARPTGPRCDVGAVEAAPQPIDAVGDVLRVDGGTTTLDVLANDDLRGFSPADIRLSITQQNVADDLEVVGTAVRFRAAAETGAFTTFTYLACLGPTDLFCDTATVTLIPDATSRFVALPPGRLFDTRPGEPGAGPKAFVEAGTSIDVQITGVAGVPSSGVSAVAMNVTATQAAGPGFITAHATGTPRPLASNLNLSAPGDTIPNFVIVPVGAGGKVTLFAQTGTHLLADVAGFFTEGGISQSAATPGTTGGRLIPLTPTRVFDTRAGESPPGPKAFVEAGQTIDVQIGGEGGVPDSGVAAVVMNLTATASDGPGFVTAFPSDVARPTASNLNLTGAGQTTPNLVVVPLGPDGKISLYSHGGTHLLGDVTGYITNSSSPRSLSGLFAPAEPTRVFDTRPDEQPPGSKGFVGAGEQISVRFTANQAVPANGVAAVMINATATAAAGPGFVTAWPDGETQPLASTLNLFFAGQTRPNAAALPIGDGNRISFFSSGGTHLLADVSGWFLE